MPQLIYLHSVPGSGTHFVKGLFNSHPDIGVIAFEPDGVASLRAIEKLYAMLLYGEISEDTFSSLLSLASWAMWNDQAWFEEKRLIYERDYARMMAPLDEDNLRIRPFVCLVGHIYPPEWGYSVNTLISKNLNAKAIVPLRDPVLILTSWIIKAAENPEMTQTMLDRVHFALSWLDKHYGREPVPTHYLPIDRPAAYYSTLIDLFEDFLGTTIPVQVIDYANEWSPVNSIPYYLRFNRSDEQRATIEACYEIRRSARRGEDPTGILPVFDERFAELQNMTRLKSLYQDHGYRDLCWF